MWRDKKYRARRDTFVAAEALLAAWFLFATVFAMKENYWTALPFLLIFLNGFAYTAGLSLWSRARPAASP